MLSKYRVLTDYQLVLKQYREAKDQRDQTLVSLGLCFEALASGAVHGRKEHSMIVRIKQLNGVLFLQSVKIAKLEIKMKRTARSKF